MKSEGVDHIRILGLEQKKNMTIGGIKFFGIIDRLDSIREDVVRIVDYKTGKVGAISRGRIFPALCRTRGISLTNQRNTPYQI